MPQTNSNYTVIDKLGRGNALPAVRIVSEALNDLTTHYPQEFTNKKRYESKGQRIGQMYGYGWEPLRFVFSAVVRPGIEVRLL